MPLKEAMRVLQTFEMIELISISNLNKKGQYGTNTFNVMLNASYLGTYYLPGVQAEAMYDNEFLVRTKGKWGNCRKVI